MNDARASLIAAGGTHEGRVRDQNEDRFFADPARGVFGVVDGVGGHPGGEHASGIAADMLRARLARETGTAAERLREAITLANNAILEAARTDPSLTGMTCVLTAAVVHAGVVTVGHVGDSRLYKLRDGTIAKLTHDHSPVGEREDAGELSEPEAMRHPRRNEVFRDVGGQPHAPEDEDFVEVVEAPFEADAALVLCSDGLSDQVPSASILEIVEACAGQPAQSVENLIRAANDAGGKDNVTVVVVEGGAFAQARGGPRPGAPAAGRDAGPASAGGGGQRRIWTSPWVMLLLGVLAGWLVAGLALYAWRPDLLQPRAAPSVVPMPEVPRTWQVGLGGQHDVASIGEALARARPGDTILLAPGEYREAFVVRQSIAIEGPETAVLRPPLGAGQGWTALEVSGAADVQVRGITIAGADGQPFSTGVHVRDGSIDLADVRIGGARDAGIEVASGARAGVRGSVLADNPGAAIVVRPRGRLTLRHSLVVHNGTAAARTAPAIDLGEGAEADIAGNAIGDNAGPAVGGPAADLAALILQNMVRPVPRTARPRPDPGARPAGAPSPR